MRCALVLKLRQTSNLETGRLGGRVLLLVSIAIFALSACDREPEAPPMRVKRVFHLNPYEKDFGYSQAVLIDKTLYISGSVAADENGRLVAAGDMAGRLPASPRISWWYPRRITIRSAIALTASGSA